VHMVLLDLAVAMGMPVAGLGWLGQVAGIDNSDTKTREWHETKERRCI
jgi:hypothetical protein